MTVFSQLDQFILDAVDSNWHKVAMVVARALTDQDLDFPESGDDAGYVAGRVDELVRTGHLQVAGDTSDWRFSEVRRTGPKVAA